MACNCLSRSRSRSQSQSPTAPQPRFGGCSFCLHVSLAGFICSWLLMTPLVLVSLSWAATLALCLPALFFTPWLALHLAGRREARGEPWWQRHVGMSQATPTDRTAGPVAFQAGLRAGPAQGSIGHGHQS